MKLPRSIVTVLVPGLLLAACGGDGPMQPGNGNGPPEDTRTILADPSFANDIVEIFVRKGCTAGNCHGGGQGGLTLSSSASVSYGNLVDEPASIPDEIRVIPGNANDSYLVRKLEGRNIVGAQMPLGGSMDNIDLTNIKNWINQGAKNN